jgi:transitional endoplasmic reticulum ATPase
VGMQLGSIPAFVAVARPPWFLNTPVLWLAALVLIALLRGPLRNAPGLLRKPLTLAVATLTALGVLMLAFWGPVLTAIQESRALFGMCVLLAGLTPIVWMVAFWRILLSKPEKALKEIPLAAGIGTQRSAPSPAVEVLRNVPEERFADFGGMEDAKEQIRLVVLGHLKPGNYERYGLLRNGILLYGPRGTGKTFLARATAGEFRLNYEYVSAPKLLNRWIGATGENIQGVFAHAASRGPVLFFIDEIDSLGSGRQDAVCDPGGAGREFNNITMGLMSAIDHYRAIRGFVLLAATNRLDGLDEALIREGRFDLKLRIDLPNEATRIKILETQLRKLPWKRFDLQEIARRVPGASAAKLRGLVSQAASYALAANRRIEAEDLRRALNGNGGTDRPQLERVEWDEVLISESVKQDLKSLVRLLEDPERTRTLGLEIPVGLLLVGPPGTGKTLIARLIASQTKRSFYPLTAANVLGGGVGDSVKRVSAVFTRAKEHSPSIIFLDEMDGLLPANNRYLAQHDIQLVEQFLTEINGLEPENNVFLVGTTNHPENIDLRVLRGGRFSEKIQIQVPNTEQRTQLLTRHLKGARLEPGLTTGGIAARLGGVSPADLQAICTAAKRMAFNRLNVGDQLPPLNSSDFEMAAERVRGAMIPLEARDSY